MPVLLATYAEDLPLTAFLVVGEGINGTCWKIWDNNIWNCVEMNDYDNRLLNAEGVYAWAYLPKPPPKKEDKT
jgi:hypothetical protein